MEKCRRQQTQIHTWNVMKLEKRDIRGISHISGHGKHGSPDTGQGLQE